MTIHDSTLTDGAVLDSIRGTSEYLAPGTHTDVEITLDEPLESDDTLFAMAHLDTNGNQMYDFLTSEGASDGPYTAGGPVMDSFDASVEQMDDGDSDMDEEEDMGDGEDMDDGDEMNEEEMDSENNESGNADDSGPGFGLIAAFVAIVGAGLLAGRRFA